MRLAHSLTLLSLATVTAVLGCGPNYRYVYNGESAFERCYALDFDVNVAPPLRSECWAAWLQSYAYGSTTDRVEYARGRLTALDLDARQQQQQQRPTVTPEAQRAPNDRSVPEPWSTTSTTAQPPRQDPPFRTLSGTADAGLAADTSATLFSPPAATATPTSNLGEPPGARCASDCRTQWSACGERCSTRDAACIVPCDERYRDCMRGCF